KSEFPKRVGKWRERGQAFHFAFMDLDDFKPLNDTYGHDCGDKVLQWTAGVFGSLLQDKGCLVRMGGDEFSLLFTADDPEALLEAGFREIRSLAAGDMQCGSAQIGFSAGIVSVDSDVDTDQSEIYKRADEALYEAKAGKGTDADRPNLVRYRWCAENDQDVYDAVSDGALSAPEPIAR
ncbi:MAG: GGDEF domain-containing protein, partial [Gammaproteobacteria bacterium]|nr:GGDEF domain-containing protein [Gammaproteobacteria bacterium]